MIKNLNQLRYGDMCRQKVCPNPTYMTKDELLDILEMNAQLCDMEAMLHLVRAEKHANKPTEDQVRIIELLMQGDLSNKAIARKLHIDRRRVDRYALIGREHGYVPERDESSE